MDLYWTIEVDADIDALHGLAGYGERLLVLIVLLATRVHDGALILVQYLEQVILVKVVLRHVQVFSLVSVASEQDAVVRQAELASPSTAIQQSHLVLVGSVSETRIERAPLLVLHHLTHGYVLRLSRARTRSRVVTVQRASHGVLVRVIERGLIALNETWLALDEAHRLLHLAILLILNVLSVFLMMGRAHRSTVSYV